MGREDEIRAVALHGTDDCINVFRHDCTVSQQGSSADPQGILPVGTGNIQNDMFRLDQAGKRMGSGGALPGLTLGAPDLAKLCQRSLYCENIRIPKVGRDADVPVAFHF